MTFQNFNDFIYIGFCFVIFGLQSSNFICRFFEEGEESASGEAVCDADSGYSELLVYCGRGHFQPWRGCSLVFAGVRRDHGDRSAAAREEKEQVKRSKMLVLNSDGDVQMKLQGGERIISMIKTRQLIKAALKAYKTDSDVDYRRVGRIVMKEFDQ